MCIGISIDDMLSGSRPIVDLYIYRYIIGVHTDLILAVLAQRTKDQCELNNVIVLLSV